jgi:uracil phosphoribosyltransferase
VNAARAAWAWSRTQAFVAVEYFFKSPSDLHERLVIVISPVLATANTSVDCSALRKASSEKTLYRM